jgi:hypothetical protein
MPERSQYVTVPVAPVKEVEMPAPEDEDELPDPPQAASIAVAVAAAVRVRRYERPRWTDSDLLNRSIVSPDVIVSTSVV